MHTKWASLASTKYFLVSHRSQVFCPKTISPRSVSQIILAMSTSSQHWKAELSQAQSANLSLMTQVAINITKRAIHCLNNMILSCLFKTKLIYLTTITKHTCRECASQWLLSSQAQKDLGDQGDHGVTLNANLQLKNNNSQNKIETKLTASIMWPEYICQLNRPRMICNDYIDFCVFL